MNLLMDQIEPTSVSKKSCKALLLVAIYREIEPTPTGFPEGNEASKLAI